MSRLAACLPLLLIVGCADQEPLAPAFAGEWSSRRMGCGGPRITIGKSGISAPGMPVNGLTFTSAEVSGGTAHLVMELGATVKLMIGEPNSGKPRNLEDPRNFEVLATLVASGDLINPNNLMFRDKKTRQLRAVPPDVLAVLALRRCEGRGGKRGFGSAELERAGQQGTPKS